MTKRVKITSISIVAWLSAIVVTTNVMAQITDHPYPTAVRDERRAAHFISKAMVRRAYAELRAMDSRLRYTSAQDAIPFSRTTIDRSSDNQAAADRTMDNFIRNRPNSPQIALAWLERGLSAMDHDNDEAAIGFFDRASAAALDRSKYNDSAEYYRIAHFTKFWQAASLARTGRHQEALDAFRATIDIDSNGIYADRAWYATGQVYERNDDVANAIASFSKVRTMYPTGSVIVASRIREAQDLLYLRKPERANDVLIGIDDVIDLWETGDTTRLAAQLDAESAREEVSLIRAEIATLRGKYAEALDSSRAFLARYPQSSYRWHVQLHAGYNALALERAQDALGHFQVILDSIVNDDDRIRQLAVLYNALALKRSGRTDEALQAFNAMSVQAGYPFQAQALIEVGQVAYEKGEYDKAKKALERAERESKDAMTSLRAQVILAAVFIEQQQWQKAASIYERIEDRANNADEAFVPNKRKYLAEARLKRGIALVQANESQKAITALTDFLGNHPDEPRRDEATFWLAESMYKNSLLKNAQELYSEIVDNFGASPRREEALYGLAWTHFRKREFEKSVAAFGEMLQDFPKSKYAVEAYARRGDGYYVMRQFRAAAEQYGQAVARGPKTDEGQYSAFQRGQAMYRLGAMDEADKAMRAYVSSYPKSSLADDALYLSGWIAFQRMDYSTAITSFQNILENYPQSDHAVRALYTIGDAKYNMADGDSLRVEDAISSYRMVMQKYPSDAFAGEAFKSLQNILLSQDRHDEAIKLADTFIESNPQSNIAEDTKFRKAGIFYSGKNYTSAAQELQDYMKKYPSAQRQDEALYLLGKTYLNLNDPVQARNAFKDLETKFPKSEYVTDALLDLAAWLDKSAQSTTADSVYKVIVDRYPEDTAASSRAGFERASLLRQRGDSVAAKDAWLAVADKYPMTEYGYQARYQVAWYYRKIRNYDSARSHLTYLTQVSDQPLLAANALYDIGYLYVIEKRFADALIPFERVRELYAGTEDWYTKSMLGLGEVYEALNRKDDAILAYQSIVSLRPDDDFGKSADARLKRLMKGRK